MKYAFSILAVAGLAAAANAQATNVIQEVSTNGSDWSSSVTVNPGATVFVRVRVALSGATALGLAGITHQPTLTNWNQGGTGDTHVAFTAAGLNNSCPPGAQTEAGFVGRHVDGTAGTATGRIFPFGSAGMNATSASGLLTSHNDAGNLLRFAGSKAVAATTNLAWGVNSAQLTPQLNGSCFVSSLDVVVFRYAVTLSSTNTTARVLSTGNAGVSQNRGTWYLNAGGTQTLNANIGTVTNATINVPTPGALALLGLGGLAVSRRRRA
jgi:uncharacterized protein (TIGR03382 family)